MFVGFDAGTLHHSACPAIPVLLLHMGPCSSSVLPHAGILHFSHNPNCNQAQFLANFGERDPGARTAVSVCDPPHRQWWTSATRQLAVIKAPHLHVVSVAWDDMWMSAARLQCNGSRLAPSPATHQDSDLV